MMKPIIAIPLGDPAGVGPEIVAKAIAKKEVLEAARCVVIGHKSVLERAIGTADVKLVIHVITTPDQGKYEAGILNLIDLDHLDISQYEMGRINEVCGRASYSYIKKSIELALSHQVAAVSTPPINKESLRAGDIPYIGHTEIFGALTKTPDPLTMFEVHGLRVFFLTRHVSLRQACDLISIERIIDYVVRCHEMLSSLGITEGTMAIAGLNPHCGEHGLFGNEEMDLIYPAVSLLKERGYQVEGPIGADSVFHLALQGRYNSVLSLYHDQGHIATKTLDFERTIAVTGGMPILRTSVDHGTAYDIAGKGIASEISMVEAILVAAKYSKYFI